MSRRPLSGGLSRDEARRFYDRFGAKQDRQAYYGCSPLSRAVATVWRFVHAARPQAVGGCRPLDLSRFGGPEAWSETRSEDVVAWGIPS